METKERNMEKEKSITNEALLNKREVLSDEALKEVAGGCGGLEDTIIIPRCNCANPNMSDPVCIDICCKTREDCPRI